MVKILENDGYTLDVDRLRQATNAADFMLIMDKINANGLKDLTFAENDLLDKSNALTPLKPVEFAQQKILQDVKPSDEIGAPTEPPVDMVINYKALANTVPANKVAQLIDDLKSGTPLSDEQAQFVIDKKIVQPKADVEAKAAAVRKMGFFDRITEYIYNNFK